MSILEQALGCDNDDAAALLIQNALGIEDGGVAAYSLPREWPTTREGRAAALAEWLKTELQFAV